MSFIALVLTLCTAVGNDSEQCNTYFIDHFAAKDQSTLKTLKVFRFKEVDPSMGNQWGDCMTRLDDETSLARLSARQDHSTKPTAKGGVSTGYRQAYLKRFNIVEPVKNIDSWEYSCVKVKEADAP